MKVFVTGGSGVLGRSLSARLSESGHEVRAPASRELDLFDPGAVAAAVADADAVYHLATRIPPPDRMTVPDAWAENDRLRTLAAGLLVDAALAGTAHVFVQPTVAFVYPPGPADEETDIGVQPARLVSALAAEAHAARFARSGRRGVVLRLGLLYGPGTAGTEPDGRYGATLHVDDAGSALLAALDAPTGVYNVVADGERVANAKFKTATGWRPRRSELHAAQVPPLHTSE